MADGETGTANKKIGGTLRDAREAAGASLDDISALLKIRSDHLQALEEDDFERLPGSVYAIGFIRTYATHLGLNAGELIERYKEAVSVPHLENQGPNPQTDVEPISGALKIAIGVMALFVVYILWLIAGGASDDDTNRIAAAPPVVAEAPTQNVEAAPTAPAEVAAPQSETGTEAEAEAEVEETPAPQADAASSDASGNLQTGSQNGAQNENRGQNGGEAEVEADVSPVEPPASAGLEAATAKVEIRAMRRTWMRIESADGRVLFSSIIREGEGFDLQDPDAYTLATRDAGSLEFFVNDVSVGTVGRRGQILTARKIERAAILAKSR
ncbi:MAG: helix-turn-helix domain-containing protein [PS1 clade bacterium]|uniref:Helix-turn-helix domain-containing protein n=1 Tax=PS1 clade bacterium TaxID=2175152 RepID=A0A937HD92_9PROT|nr:helix-turn-helix domain-containing protein [PS1 clade bacterium]